MPFDSSTRGRLQKMVTSCRRTLTDEFTSQFQSIYGIQPTGEITDLVAMSHLDDEQHTVASLLRERIDHLAGGHSSDKKAAREAIDRVIREQAFTVLNRLSALRMCEERGIVQECIRGGFQSRGFQVYSTTVGASLGGIYERYRVFLQCVFDEISVDLGILFDRFSPFGHLFPGEPALVEVLKFLNDSELKEIWKDDETIGWIYQYFNSKEEREVMRKASSAPRNSRELAVRNQFFTPRYVVEFLTDNTLGRIWYEMTKGETRLKDECRYLMRRPNEVFLDEGKEAPAVAEEDLTEKSQQDLLRETVYIAYRPLKDPREILMLDPACGSMHFGLYAYDLYEQIYWEAWDNYPTLMLDLREVCRTREDFLKRVPALVLRYNIHGIDIDPRATQIAGLSLWLRAMRSYQELGLKPSERPRITRANVVCAEAMPGEKDLLDEFINSFRGEQRIVGELVREVWDKMQLAGEAGSLLRIEEELKGAIDRIRKEWVKVQRGEPFDQLHIWNKERPPKQLDLHSALKKIKGEEFWDQVEEMVMDVLCDFAKSSGNGKGYQRKLFAEDAAQGFAFIDLCRKRYDTVLMNPPFGEPSNETREYVRSWYRNTNLLCAFVFRSIELSFGGMIGAITDSTWLKKTDYSDLRKNLLAGGRIPFAIADLGWGVLDGANVAVCAFTISVATRTSDLIALRLVDAGENEKGDFFLVALEEIMGGNHKPLQGIVFRRSAKFFQLFPENALAYETPNILVRAFMQWRPLTAHGVIGRRGYTPGDTFRFFRAWWEVPAEERGMKWWTLNNGSSFIPFIGEGFIAAFREDDWRQYRELSGFRLESEEFFGRSGLGYGKRTDFMYCYPLPEGSMFSNEGHCIFPKKEVFWQSMAYLNSGVCQALINLYCGQHKTAGYVSKVPTPDLMSDALSGLGKEVREFMTRYKVLAAELIESGEQFLSPPFTKCISLKSVSSGIERIASDYHDLLLRVDKAVLDLLRPSELDEQDYQFLLEKRPLPSLEKSLQQQNCDVLHYAVGCAFGRWDMRIVMEQSLAPKLGEVYEASPVCPPGMLIGPSGLPAKTSGIVSEEWIRARPKAITLPPEGSVSRPTIPNDEYPLRITWSGILLHDADADETHAHREDIVRRVREVLDLLWGEKAHAIEQEACEILGVSSLREYFRKPSAFFDDHLKRYSKSRRKAPIYWPLSTESGSYTLWIYYHRLTDQTLYQSVNDYIDPKLESVSQDVEKLRGDVLKGGTAKQRDEFEKLQKLQQELTDFRRELLRVAELPYKPDLNDGVLITASPLHKLFRLPRWRKDLEECWKKLESGEYDWAHLAYSIWPNRVREMCKKDKSIAIAHGLEELYEEPEVTKKPKRGRKRT